ncbi:MAG TPA: 2Fe-2S iron-sulfur cluster-binding protein [Nitrospiria bacterium]
MNSKLQNEDSKVQTTESGESMEKKEETPGGKKHKVTFLPANVTVEVDESKYPYQEDGRPGSLLDIALGNNIQMGHNCGGNCACTTCHIVVKEGMENLSEMEDDEQDRLDMAEGLTLQSRLGCQSVVKGDVVVEIKVEEEYGVD